MVRSKVIHVSRCVNCEVKVQWTITITRSLITPAKLSTHLHLAPKRRISYATSLLNRSSQRQPPQSLQLRRYATASENAQSKASTAIARTRSLVISAILGSTLVLGYYYVTDTRAGVHRWVTVPVLRWLYPDAEEAHEFGTKALKMLHQWGLHPRERDDPDAARDLEIEVLGDIHMK